MQLFPISTGLRLRLSARVRVLVLLTLETWNLMAKNSTTKTMAKKYTAFTVVQSLVTFKQRWMSVKHSLMQ